MEPEQELLGARREAVEPIAHRREVLADRLVALHRPIEADAVGRRLVVVDVAVQSARCDFAFSGIGA